MNRLHSGWLFRLNNSSEKRDAEKILEGKVVIERGVTGAFFGSKQEDVLSSSGKSVEKNDFLDLGLKLKTKPTNKTESKEIVEGKHPLSETDQSHILLEAALQQIQEEKLKGEKNKRSCSRTSIRRTLSPGPEPMTKCCQEFLHNGRRCKA